MGRRRATHTHWTTQDDDHLTQLHADGLSPDQIARAMGRHPGTIGRKARRLGLTWGPDVTATLEEKRRQHAERLRLKRLAAAEDSLDLADELLTRAGRPHTYRELGGKDRDRWVTYKAREPSPADQAKLAQAAVVLIQTAVKVDEHETGGVRVAQSISWRVEGVDVADVQ